MTSLEFELCQKFDSWFRRSGVAYWSECNAPEELAEIAAKYFKERISLKLLGLFVLAMYGAGTILFQIASFLGVFG